ncbi:MAG TPA: PLP-dependent aminotransferase family protein [Thermoanaerobaculia bacterium]|nr:PLP-dependent aminotransferase family protein [Thermoanaerobaculia bacterium]
MKKGTNGRELLVELPPGRGGGRALEAGLRDAIRGGRLVSGAALPGSRALAADLGVSRRLVVEVYEQLTAEGYLETTPRGATRVAAWPVEKRALPEPVSVESKKPRFEFRTGQPDLTFFPERLFRRLLRDALLGADRTLLGYGDPAGQPALRGAIASYLGRVRGAVASRESVFAFSGMASAIAAWARWLASRKVRRVALEDPCSDGYLPFLAAEGLEVVPCPVDEDGIVVEALEKLRVEAVLVTPAHQFPMGSVLAAPRRAALLSWARARGAFILEDDYDAEYRYDREAVGCLQGLGPDRVFLAGTVSKTLAPGLRLGWLVVPPKERAAMSALRPGIDLGQPGLEQEALRRLLDEGHYDRHVRRTRRLYKARRDALVTALSSVGVTVRGAAAGLHLIADLPKGTNVPALVAGAATRGIGITSLERYSYRKRPPALVIGYGAIAAHDVTEAFDGLVDVLAAFLRVPRRPRRRA